MRHAKTLSQETIVLKENLPDSEIPPDHVELCSLLSANYFVNCRRFSRKSWKQQYPNLLLTEG